ncbi:hypothetical protein [Polyangium jinanense]|uniref:Uncharacterized protein n=1 Tax=Polyangium jinanense TaxID=2829994 RepID=A0A9X3X172_9BACT|nr:hypothetical protein [Polyangium jinanense]MDC3953309.1 hypothetical protein [Polyangium jinanense]MDC3979571.1 hypothetical protein [Polyangium jinanense]
MKKRLAFGTLGELLVLAHSEQPPTDPEWKAYIEAWEVHHRANGRSRLLVCTEGGAPTAAQRHILDERVRTFSRDSARAAILSESLFARVVTNALSAMEHARASRFLGGLGARGGPDASQIYRMFARTDLRQALVWLDVSPAREPEVVRYIEQLKDVIKNSG